MRIPIYESQVRPLAMAETPLVTQSQIDGGIGRTLAAIGDDMGRREEVRAEKAAAAKSASDRLGVASSLAQFKAVTAKVRQTARQSAAADGKSHTDGVLADFDQRQTALLEGITDPNLRSWAATQLVDQRGDLDIDETGYAAGLAGNKAAADFDAMVGVTANTLFQGGTARDLGQGVALVEETIAGLTQLPATAKAELVQKARWRLGRSYVEGLAERDPYAARAALAGAGKPGDPQAGPDGGALPLAGLLDPDSFAMLKNRVDVEIRQRETAARAEAAAAEREQREAANDRKAEVTAALRDWQDGVRLGLPVSPRELAQVVGLARQTGNTALARNVQALGEASVVTTAMRGLSLNGMSQVVTQLDAEAAAGKGNNMLAALRAKAARDYMGAAATGVQRNPLDWASSQGQVQLPQLAGDTPEAFALAAKARVVAGDAVARRYGTPLAVLSDGEVAAYGARFSAAAAPAAKLAVLQELQALGERGGAAALRQIAGREPLVAMAGALLGSKSGGVSRAMTLIAGMDRLKTDPKAVDDTDTVRIKVLPQVGGALRGLPQLAGSIVNVVRAYHAGRVASGEAEGVNITMGGTLNTVLGQARYQDGKTRGGLATRNGDTLLLPETMTIDEFDGALSRVRLDKLPAEQLPRWDDGKAMTAADVGGLFPFAVGANRYRFSRQRGGSPVVRGNGQPFEVVMP